MGHTYTSLAYHVVFSTKQRRAWLSEEVRPRLVEFVGGVVRQRKGRLLGMNGPGDHVHVLAILSAATALSAQVRDIKALSSGWIHDTFAGLGAFAWQEGYSAFTVGPGDLDRVRRYIARQQEHHKTTTFEQELIAMLDRAGVEYDPKYLFD